MTSLVYELTNIDLLKLTRFTWRKVSPVTHLSFLVPNKGLWTLENDTNKSVADDVLAAIFMCRVYGLLVAKVWMKNDQSYKAYRNN